ncbi:hypothetical protein FRC02_009640 [Tulasnella sp. 418]|nr:hypothetical protein FRC02_009640 [Tulasnella sp. 418]
MSSPQDTQLLFADESEVPSWLVSGGERSWRIFRIATLECLRELDIRDVTPYWDSFLPNLKKELAEHYTIAVNSILKWYDDRRYGPRVYGRIYSAGYGHLAEDMAMPIAVFRCNSMGCELPLWMDTFHIHEHFTSRYYDHDMEATSFCCDGLLSYSQTNTKIVERLINSHQILRSSSTKELLAKGECYVCNVCDLKKQIPVGFIYIVKHFLKVHYVRLLNLDSETCGDKPLFRFLTPRTTRSRIRQYAGHLAGMGVDEHHAREHLIKGGLTEDNCCFHCRNSYGHRLKFDVEEVDCWAQIVYHLYDCHDVGYKLLGPKIC